jgi:hypothetical protein
MSLDMLQNLVGGGKRQEFEDFVSRFDDGPPDQGYTGEEAAARHDEVASNLSDDDYELSAKEAYERLAPDQRRQLAKMIRQGGKQQNVDLGEFDSDDDDRDADPEQLARMTRKVKQQQPGGIGALLGGSGGGGVGALLENPAAKAALAGIAAMAAKKVLHR